MFTNQFSRHVIYLIYSKFVTEMLHVWTAAFGTEVSVFFGVVYYLRFVYKAAFGAYKGTFSMLVP